MRIKEIENSLNNWTSKRSSLQKEYDTLKTKQGYMYERFSTIFGLLAVIITILFSLMTMIGEEKISDFFSPIDKFTESNKFLLNLILGIFASFVSISVAVYFRKISNRYKKFK